jgi:hypothetical protein
MGTISHPLISVRITRVRNPDNEDEFTEGQPVTVRVEVDSKLIIEDEPSIPPSPPVDPPDGPGNPGPQPK